MQFLTAVFCESVTYKLKNKQAKKQASKKKNKQKSKQAKKQTSKNKHTSYNIQKSNPN